MEIGLLFANSGPFSTPERLGHLAQTAERCGIESIWTVEHVVIPQDYKSTYPYSPSGRIPGGDEVPIPDPLLPLAYAAALTTRLRLATGIVILPLRHPLYVAKELATLDVLSHGRMIFGVGSGWLREEFESLGLDFDSRGARTDEAIEAIRVLWRESSSRFAGKHFNFGPVKSFPKPVHKGGVPIHIGGHSKAAARRAARLGDGFFPMEPEPQPWVNRPCSTQAGPLARCGHPAPVPHPCKAAISHENSRSAPPTAAAWHALTGNARELPQWQSPSPPTGDRRPAWPELPQD